MKNYMFSILSAFAGITFALITVYIIAAIVGANADDIVGWIALGMAGAQGLTKQERF